MKKFLRAFSWSSLKGKILMAFMITSIFPTLMILIFSYVNTSRIVKDHAEELTHTNLEQTRSSLDIWVDSYEDILFQIYMNDDIVDMVEELNEGRDITMVTGQLRRTLRGMFYTKEHIKCITVITESGRIVFYDLLTGAATQTSWLGSIGMDQQEIYDLISEDNSTHVIPTKKAGVFAAKTYYLFHLGHRIIDYQNVNRQLGVVIMSIDEEMLQEICGKHESKNSLTFMVAMNGEMISSREKALLGSSIIPWSDSVEERRQAYQRYLKENDLLDIQSGTVDVVYDQEFEADIVHVSNQDELLKRLNAQQKIMLIMLGMTTLVVLCLIVTLTRNLMGSINRLVETMKIAGKGKLSVRAVWDDKTPTEIRTIETQFNIMLDKLERSVEKEKEANEKQKNAEIMALEAQINPHFLYNTLDTINWMAIDKDEYEISNSITSLASILRYGIDNSNAVVKISREVEWLKQYLFLQQTRLKNTFECEIDVSPEVLGWNIHKLLFQPFIENAILHGFEGKKGVHILKITIVPKDEKLLIEIWDNGNGISAELVEQMNEGQYPGSKERNCIGMENAIMRLQMYYGAESSARIESKLGEYTRIRLYVPKCVD